MLHFWYDMLERQLRRWQSLCRQMSPVVGCVKVKFHATSFSVSVTLTCYREVSDMLTSWQQISDKLRTCRRQVSDVIRGI